MGRISGLGGGLCLRFHPKCSKFGTVLHLGPKILGKIKNKNLGLKGPFLDHRKCKKWDFVNFPKNIFSFFMFLIFCRVDLRSLY